MPIPLVTSQPSASPAFTVVSPTSTQSTSIGSDTLLAVINGQVAELQLMSGIFFGVTTFMFLVLGFLLWRNDQLRKEAEKNSDAIKKMYQETANIMNQSKAMIENLTTQIKIQLERAVQNVKQIEDSAAKIKTKESQTLSQQAIELKGNLNNSLISLSTVSGTIPSFPNITTVVSGNYPGVSAMYTQGSVSSYPVKSVEVDLHNTPNTPEY